MGRMAAGRAPAEHEVALDPPGAVVALLPLTPELSLAIWRRTFAPRLPGFP